MTWGIAFSAYQAGTPLLFVLIPGAMGFTGVCILISVLRARGTSPFDAMRERLADLANQASYGEMPGPEVNRSVYDLSDRCPSCGGSIDMESVDWVGPMTARCPYCSSTIKLELRDV